MCLAAWQQAEDTEVRYAFFSGTVAAVAENSVTVTRSVPGKPDETRSFSITEETVVEGKLKAGARVTVGYTQSEQGDLALRIIVR
jgi:hypothetical protein